MHRENVTSDVDRGRLSTIPEHQRLGNSRPVVVRISIRFPNVSVRQQPARRFAMVIVAEQRDFRFVMLKSP
jgi:hypothetical protein